jgi:hypothetical protein
MKVIITESQLNDMVPLRMRRKVSLIYSWIDTLFNSEDYKNTTERQAKSMTLDNFMTYSINFIESLLFMDITSHDLSVIKNSIKFIIHDRVVKFWKEANGIK